MVTSKAKVTPQGKAYEAIIDTRKKLTAQRRKTRDMFNSNQLLRKEAVGYLKGIYTTRGVTGYRSDPGYTYYREFMERVTHCHNREYLKGTLQQLFSNLISQFGNKPSGDAAKLKTLLEGRLQAQLEKYFGQYQADVKLEEKLQKLETEFLEKYEENELPPYQAPTRPEPFNVIDDDYDMPALPSTSSSASDSETIELCGAPCTGHGREGKPCEKHLGSDGVCQYHGARESSEDGDEPAEVCS